jgi:hypothetical protein
VRSRRRNKSMCHPRKFSACLLFRKSSGPRGFPGVPVGRLVSGHVDAPKESCSASTPATASRARVLTSPDRRLESAVAPWLPPERVFSSERFVVADDGVRLRKERERILGAASPLRRTTRRAARADASAARYPRESRSAGGFEPWESQPGSAA